MYTKSAFLTKNKVKSCSWLVVWGAFWESPNPYLKPKVPAGLQARRKRKCKEKQLPVSDSRSKVCFSPLRKRQRNQATPCHILSLLMLYK